MGVLGEMFPGRKLGKVSADDGGGQGPGAGVGGGGAAGVGRSQWWQGPFDLERGVLDPAPLPEPATADAELDGDGDAELDGDGDGTDGVTPGR